MHQIRTLLLLLPSPLFAQAWTLVDSAPSDIAQVFYDSAEGRAVALSGFPTSVWSFTAGRWRRILPDGLEGTVSMLAGYDQQRESSVLVVNGSGIVPIRTFVSSGAGWLPISTNLTPTLFDPSTVFDGNLGQVLVFGGMDVSQWMVTDDTFVWSGNAWSQLQPAVRPSPRQGAGMAYDPIRGCVVLFGGRDTIYNTLADTWEWDGSTWTQRSPNTSPSARSGDLAYDPVAQRIVQLGGHGQGNVPVTDSWIWDGSTWTARGAMPGTGFGKGWNDGIDLFVVEGHGANVWLSNGAGWVPVFTNQEAPEHHGAALAFDPARSEVLLASGGSNSDTWAWNGKWQRRATIGPSSRTGADVAPLAGTMVLFGGMQYPLTLVGDTWLWNGTSWALALSPLQPAPRSRHRMTSTGAHVLLFGGIGSFGALDDLWQFDGTSWTQLPTTIAPAPRSDHGFAFDPVRQRAVLWGGNDAHVYKDDTWEWDGVAWTQCAPVTVPPAVPADLVYDASRSVVVLAQSNGLWQWNGADWSPGSMTGSNVMSGGRCTYDATRQRLVGYSQWAQTAVYEDNPGRVEIAGFGCGVANDLRLFSRPAIGTTPQLHLQASANSLAAVAFGLSQQTVFWTPLCVQQITIDASVFSLVNGSGVLDQPLVLPNALSFRGLQVFVQAVVLDGGPALGTSFTWPLAITVGQ